MDIILDLDRRQIRDAVGVPIGRLPLKRGDQVTWRVRIATTEDVDLIGGEVVFAAAYLAQGKTNLIHKTATIDSDGSASIVPQSHTDGLDAVMGAGTDTPKTSIILDGEFRVTATTGMTIATYNIPVAYMWGIAADISDPENLESTTLQIGKVSTLPAGASATASITYAAGVYSLNLGIPQGAKGDPGEAELPDNVVTADNIGSYAVTLTGDQTISGLKTYANDVIFDGYIRNNSGVYYSPRGKRIRFGNYFDKARPEDADYIDTSGRIYIIMESGGWNSQYVNSAGNWADSTFSINNTLLTNSIECNSLRNNSGVYYTPWGTKVRIGDNRNPESGYFELDPTHSNRSISYYYKHTDDDAYTGPANLKNILLDTATISQSLDMAGGKILNLAAPTSNKDAANKAYVDANAGGGTVPENVITVDNIASHAVTSIGGSKGAITLGEGLSISGQVLSAPGGGTGGGSVDWSAISLASTLNIQGPNGEQVLKYEPGVGLQLGGEPTGAHPFTEAVTIKGYTLGVSMVGAVTMTGGSPGAGNQADYSTLTLQGHNGNCETVIISGPSATNSILKFTPSNYQVHLEASGGVYVNGNPIS